MASVVINAQPGQVLQLGRLHSSGQVIVNFNLNSWRDAFNDHPDGRVVLYYSALDDNTPSMTVIKTMTVAEVQANNNIFPWDVEYLITNTPGPGYCQIILQSTDGNFNYGSYMYQTVVTKSVYYFNTDEESAAVYNKWLDRISSIYTAVDDITASAEFVDEEVAGGVEVTKNDYGSVNLHFKLPAAPQFKIDYDFPSVNDFEAAFSDQLFNIYDFIIINGNIIQSENSRLFMSTIDMTETSSWEYAGEIVSIVPDPERNFPETYKIYKAQVPIDYQGFQCGAGDYITYFNEKWIYAVNYLSDLSGTTGIGISAVTVDEDGKMYVTYTDGTVSLVEGDAYYTAINNIRTTAETAKAVAVEASNSADESASVATSAATTATSKANEAANSKTSAQTSATAAATSESNSNNSALKSEGFAVGTQNGTAVQPGSTYYNNNSYYYSQQASQSGSDAQGSALKAEGYAIGTQNGTPATSGQLYFEDNAKYYAEDAKASSVSAQTSASSAKSNATNVSNMRTEVVELRNQVTTASSTAINAAADASTYADNASTSAGVASAAVTSSNNYSLASEGYALGEQNGYAVTTGSPYYQNSSKYYANQSNLSSQNSQSFADNSRASSLIAEGYSIGTQDGQEQQSGTYFENNAKYYAEEAQNSAETANADVLLSKYWAEGNRANPDGPETRDGGNYYTKNSQYYAIQARYWAEGKLDTEGNEIRDIGDSFNSTKQYFNNARYYKEYIERTEAGVSRLPYNTSPRVTSSSVDEFNTTTGNISGRHLKLNFELPQGYPGDIFIPLVDSNSDISWTQYTVKVDSDGNPFWAPVENSAQGIPVIRPQNIAGLPAEIESASATVTSKVGDPSIQVTTTTNVDNPRFFSLRFAFDGIKGEQGEPGKGIVVLGVVDTYNDLPQNPSPGDIYNVKTEQEGIYTTYLYDGINHEWVVWMSGTSVREIVKGYLFNNTFYYDPEHQNPIIGSTDALYIEKNEDVAYHWNSTSYDKIEDKSTLHFTLVPGNPLAQNQFLYYNGTGWTNTNLPVATTSTKGIMQVGDGLVVADGVVSINNNFVTIDTTNNTLQFLM